MELEINLPEDFTESTETIELTKPRKKKKGQQVGDPNST